MDPSERSALIRQGRQLERQHAEHVKRASLLLDAKTHWKGTLNASERRDRDYILLALKSEKIPYQLDWGCFEYHYGMEQRTDREIFLQRLDLESFLYYKDRCYSKLPVLFRNDKEVMIKVVSKSSKTLSVASEELQNDRDVVMAALRGPDKTAPLSFQYASKKLQGDKEIALAMLSHEYGITAFHLLPRKLKRDYSLALWAIQSTSDECNKFYEALSKLPEEMLDDYDIVYEAVQRRGSNLRLVRDELLLNDLDIVMAACENDGAAIEYVPEGPTRDELLLESNLLVLLENGGHCVLKELGDEYMMDRKYLLPAVKNGMLLSSEFASKLYQDDRTLFMDALHHSNKPFQLYDSLPDDIRGDSSVGLAILKSKEGGSWARRFATDIPDDIARTHVDTLIKFARNKRLPFNFEGGVGIWDNKDIAISLCKIEGRHLEEVSSRLQKDADVVKAALQDSKDKSIPISALTKVPQELFRNDHDLAAMAVKAGQHDSWRNGGRLADLFRHLGKDVFSCRVVFSEWIKRGWTYHYGSEETIPFANDRVMALEAIKHAAGGNVGDVLSKFSSRFRNEKKFMLSAIEANPALCGCGRFAEDFDFMLRGISASKDLSGYSHEDEDFFLLSDFASFVRERLTMIDGFILEFLGAISMSLPDRKRRRTGRRRAKCHLPMLDLGVETNTSIKRTIAEFAGIPLGRDIKMLRLALENLKFWGY